MKNNTSRLTLVLVLAAHHEARDVLQEEQGHLALAAQLDEVRRLCTCHSRKKMLLK
jgi:hypothetical protein